MDATETSDWLCVAGGRCDPCVRRAAVVVDGGGGVNLFIVVTLKPEPRGPHGYPLGSRRRTHVACVHSITRLTTNASFQTSNSRIRNKKNKNPVELLFISSAFVRLSCLQLCQFRPIIATFLRPKAESTRITVTTSNERKKKILLPSTLSLSSLIQVFLFVDENQEMQT